MAVHAEVFIQLEYAPHIDLKILLIFGVNSTDFARGAGR